MPKLRRRSLSGLTRVLGHIDCQAAFLGSYGWQALGQPSSVTATIMTANVFFAGHRIRLEVSSSNFPRFDRNTNTGGVIARETEANFVVATNTVLHDAGHPSHVVLPVVRR